MPPLLGATFLILGVAFFPLVTNGQQEISAGQAGYGQSDWVRTASYTHSEPQNALTSNVPLNEINIHAYRHFHRLFPSGTMEESWFKSPEGYQVSFTLDAQRHQANFNLRGAFLYSLKYYGGKEIPRSTGELFQKKYPDYRTNGVTENTDGEKTFFLVRIANPSFIRTLSVCDGRIESIEEMINGGADGQPAENSR